MKGLVAGALTAVAVPLLGVALYLGSDAHADHDRVHALQQLDLLYLDEPAPGARELGLRPGTVHVLVFCGRPDCPLPVLAQAEVHRVRDRGLAARYALSGGTGYALVDRALRVRYRSFDPQVDRDARELQVLVDALRTGAVPPVQR